jgi:hypothetical protein
MLKKKLKNFITARYVHPLHWHVWSSSPYPQSTPTSPYQRPSKGLHVHYSQNKGATNSSLKWPQGKGPQ